MGFWAGVTHELKVLGVGDDFTVMGEDELGCGAIEVSYDVVSHENLGCYHRGGERLAVDCKTEHPVAFVYKTL